MGARRRHLSRSPTKRQPLDERLRTLEQPINEGDCNGLRVIFQYRGRKHESKIRAQCCQPTCDTTGSKRPELHASRRMEAPTLEGFCCVEHPCRTPGDPCFSKSRITTNAQALTRIQKLNAKEATTCPLQSRRRACCGVRTNLVAQSARC